MSYSKQRHVSKQFPEVTWLHFKTKTCTTHTCGWWHIAFMFSVGMSWIWRHLYMVFLTHWGRDKMAAVFGDDISKLIFLNKNECISIKISLKFVSRGSINNIPALVRIMARRRPGDEPLSDPIMVRLPTHKCVIRPPMCKHTEVENFADDYFKILFLNENLHI